MLQGVELVGERREAQYRSWQLTGTELLSLLSDEVALTSGREVRGSIKTFWESRVAL